MNRITAREIAVQAVYALEFSQFVMDLAEERTDPSFYEAMSGESTLFDSPPDSIQQEYIRDILIGVEARKHELDEHIIRHAKGWKISRLPLVTLAILRVCVYELLHRPDVPERSAINAAVEISKHYEPAEMTSYINGVLGAFIRQLRPDIPAAELTSIEDEPLADDGEPLAVRSEQMADNSGDGGAVAPVPGSTDFPREGAREENV